MCSPLLYGLCGGGVLGLEQAVYSYYPNLNAFRRYLSSSIAASTSQS